jgi:hypothetical protein
MLLPMRWIGPALGVLGLAAVAAMLLHAAPDRLLAERGALSVLLSVELALPLIGLGLAAALVPSREAAAAALLFAAGLVIGFYAREWLLSVIVTGAAAVYRLSLIGPVACLAAGVTLVATGWPRRGLLPFAGVVVGVALGLAITLNDPSFHDRSFPRGAIAATTWLAVAVGLTGRGFGFDRPWLGIGARIFGSWLIAIGLLLGGATIARQYRALPKPPAPAAKQTPAPGSLTPPPPTTPGPRPPDADPWHQP